MKKVIIVSLSNSAAKMYADSIIEVFGEDRINIETIIAELDDVPKDGDLYLISKGHIESKTGVPIYAKFDFPIGIPVVDIIVEFCKDDIKPLYSLKKGTVCLLVNSTEMLAMECISDLHNTMGVYHLNMFPYGGESHFYSGDIKTAVTVGEPELVPYEIESIIDIGARKLSPKTMAEIAVYLKMEEILDSESFYSYRKKFTGDAAKVGDLIAGSSYYKNFIEIMIECLDDGIIGINEKEKIFCINKKAERILEVKGYDLFGESVEKMLPHIWNNNYMSLEKGISFLTKYRGTDLNLTINPINRNGVNKGVLIVVQEFYEQEKKQNKTRLQLFEKGYRAKYEFSDIVRVSARMKEVCEMAEKMANSASTVLITGETGTGKELLASAIHNASPRRNEPYIAINCSAIADNLLESELFGYDEGAFTGAKKTGKLGLFEYAHRGTLFLDEIEDMSSALQLKLLRVLQEKEIMHIGGDRIIKVDVRIIAATNENLDALVKQGRIRKDLYYRLNTLQIELPPLRERIEDIIPLMKHIKRQKNAEFELDDEVKAAFELHNWDGNVRELQNCIEYFSCLQKKVIHYADLPITMRKQKHLEIDGETCAVVKQLYYAYVERRHAGRKSIAEALKKEGLFLSEQQIRSIIGDLEKRNLVMVSKGPAGTRLTPDGMRYCMELFDDISTKK